MPTLETVRNYMVQDQDCKEDVVFAVIFIYIAFTVTLLNRSNNMIMYYRKMFSSLPVHDVFLICRKIFKTETLYSVCILVFGTRVC